MWERWWVYLFVFVESYGCYDCLIGWLFSNCLFGLLIYVGFKLECEIMIFVFFINYIYIKYNCVSVLKLLIIYLYVMGILLI